MNAAEFSCKVSVPGRIEKTARGCGSLVMSSAQTEPELIPSVAVSCGSLRWRLLTVKRQSDKAFARVLERFRLIPKTPSDGLKIPGPERGRWVRFPPGTDWSGRFATSTIAAAVRRHRIHAALAGKPQAVRCRQAAE